MSKVKITTYVDEKTAGILRARAAQNEISMSEACSNTLQAAVKDEAAEGVGTELLLPAVRGAVRREVRRMSDRLAVLLARSALDSSAERRALYQLLVAEFGPDEAAEINRRAWMRAVADLRSPSQGLREILADETHDTSGESATESPKNGSRAGAAQSGGEEDPAEDRNGSQADPEAGS